MNCGPEPLRPLASAYACVSQGRLQRGAVLSVAATAVGLLTTFSGVFIQMASNLLADTRHGACVERLEGDTRPLWEATFGGGWRPYDRMRCCGGSSSVDHATEECRALSIITQSTRKRFAFPLHSAHALGREVEPAQLPMDLMMIAEFLRDRVNSSEEETARSTASSAIRYGDAGGDTAATGHEHLSGDAVAYRQRMVLGARSSGAAKARSHARSRQLREQVGADAKRVRAHMSHLFGHDPTERWAEESSSGSVNEGRYSSLAAEITEVAVNEGVVQTQSESAGSSSPIYEWVPWERALMARGRSAALLIYVLGSGLFALLAALVTWSYPFARGSGIPEVKASVAGFAIPRSFKARTLAAKVIALSLCVGAGLAVGPEGPMIHIGACWGVLLYAPISRLGHFGSPIAETDLICVGAAAGVAAAFGAPLAGVLFAVEELGTSMPSGLRYSTMLCAFGSAVVAALALKWLDLTHTQRLTLFEVDYKQTWALWEAVPFCLLGILGGVLGGAFVLANEAVHRRRLRAQAEGRLGWYLPAGLDGRLRRLLGGAGPPAADPRVLEVVLLAVLTGFSNYPHMLTRMLQNDAITALFSQCPEPPFAAGAQPVHRGSHDPTGLCTADNALELWALMRLLCGAAMLRFFQAAVTIGAFLPGGLFVPSLYMGGCVGRALGSLLRYVGMAGAKGSIEPGIYAMVGAGAMLAGVSRLTVCLVVVLFELTGGLTYVVPFMLSVLIAKWTGDAITNGRSVYDAQAGLNGFAKVEQSDDVRFLNATLQDLGGCTGSALAAEAGKVVGKGMPPALWVNGGLAWSSDLAVHCRAADAGAGFAVLSLGPREEVDVLGWARPAEILKILADKCTDAGGTSTKAERWCQFSAAAPPPPVRAQPPGPPVEDFRAALDARGVVRVRSDCPVQTAYCIFEGCPAVKALVAVEGKPLVVRTMTRDLFMFHLLPSCICPVPGSSRPGGMSTIIPSKAFKGHHEQSVQSAWLSPEVVPLRCPPMMRS